MKKLSILFVLLVTLCFASHAQVITTIDSIRQNDANGVTIANGLRVQVSGIVYGPNGYPTPNGDVFMLRCDTMSIKVYSGHTYGYTVTDGDSVIVVGTVSDYHGQTELSPNKTVPGDTIIKLGTGTIQSPVLISQATSITEVNESQLIQVNNINMTQATWSQPPHTSASHPNGYHTFTAHAPYNGTIVNVYFFVDSFLSPDVWGANPTTTWVGVYNIVGFGSQYVTTPPNNGGYSLQPRRLSDFHLVSGVNELSNGLMAVTYPNPASTKFNVVFSYEKEANATVRIMDVTGKVVISENRRVVNGENNYAINTSELSNGLYILEVNTGEKTLVTKFNIAN